MIKRISLALLLGVAVAAQAQVPIVGSTVHGTVSVSSAFAYVTAQPGGAVTGTTAGYVGYGQNSSGDMDFIAANNGSSPSFYWYYLLGSSQTAQMWLDTSAVLHVPGGISGTASLANALASAPTNCGDGHPSYGVAASGNALCMSTYRVLAINITAGICTTPSAAYASCASTFYLSPDGTTTGAVTFSSAPAVSCSAGPGQGTNAILGGVFVDTISTTQFNVTLQNTGTSGGEGATTTNEIHCTASHN